LSTANNCVQQRRRRRERRANGCGAARGMGLLGTMNFSERVVMCCILSHPRRWAGQNTSLSGSSGNCLLSAKAAAHVPHPRFGESVSDNRPRFRILPDNSSRGRLSSRPDLLATLLGSEFDGIRCEIMMDSHLPGCRFASSPSHSPRHTTRATHSPIPHFRPTPTQLSS